MPADVSLSRCVGWAGVERAVAHGVCARARLDVDVYEIEACALILNKFSNYWPMFSRVDWRAAPGLPREPRAPAAPRPSCRCTPRSESIFRASISAKPSRFWPRHVFLSAARLSFSRSPTPQMKSLGDASTSMRLSVPKSRRSNFGFCSNLCTLPATTILKRCAFHVPSLKPLTRRPSDFCSLGLSAARILANASLSRNKRAFSAIIQCSAQLYCTPSTTNTLGCHWLR